MAKSPFERPVPRAWLYFAAIAAVFTACAAATLFTKLPLWEEGVYATFGHNLLVRGHMINLMVDSSQPRWRGVDQANFWTMPLHPMLQSVWYRVFGFSLAGARSLSLLMGIAGLIAFFRVVRRICGDGAALLGSAFVALDRNFVLSAAIGRPDMMSLAFALVAYDLYLTVRQRSLAGAIALSSACATLSFFTHPVGGVCAIGSLLYLALRYDRCDLRPHHILAAALPFACGAVIYAAYALRYPGSFLPMIHERFLPRLWSIGSPLQGLRGEGERYLRFFGFNESDSGASRIKLIFLFGYAAGVGGVIVSAKRFRNSGSRAVFALLAIAFCTLWFVEGSKHKIYLVYVSFLLSLCLALTCLALYRSAKPHWKLAAGFLCLIPLMQGASLVRLGLVNNVRRYYQPAIEQLNAPSNRTVFASSALVFGLRPDLTVIDDDTLGFSSHRTADAIAVNLDTQEALAKYEKTNPAVARHMHQLIEQGYRSVVKNTGFEVLAKTAR